ncbi:MAG TPA: CHAT domain-containing protein, partial [Kofleriaceae bacterium]|nr:CHAT domain-containing protein [Kofleriaceae bacterium]
LFVATHAGIDEHGGYLALADGPLYALELSQRPAAPEIVILSSCVSALSNALGPAGSLAAAFLAAGSSQVVATLRRVSDPGSHELITAFFADGGTRDPVRALARVQARLADTPNTDWPSFAVFGQDFCPSSP